MDKAELDEILRLHKAWLNKEPGGMRANLQDAVLLAANLQDADLRGAVLRGANLWRANLQRANLWRANLQDANLQDADLRGADLQGADLQDAKCGFNAFFAGVKGAPFFQAVCGFGSRNAALTLLALGERKEWRWFTGCFTGGEDELRAAVAEKHGESKAGRCYLRAIDYLAAQAEDNISND